MVKEKIVIFLFFLFFALYFFASPKIIHGSNDGAHFALLRNLDTGQIKLDDRLMPYTGYVNFAKYGEKRYSDRPPGMAILAAPFYFVAKGLSRVFPFELNSREMESSISGMQENNQDIFPARSFGIGIVHLVPILLSAATISILFLFLCLYTTRVWPSFVLASLFGLGTLFAKYATVFLSHNVSVFLTMVVIWLLFRIKKLDSHKKPWEYAVLGFCLGFMALFEYQMAILGLGVLIIIISFGCRRFFGIPLGQWINGAVLCFLAWGAVPVLAMACYQYFLFDNPLSTTYSYHGFYLYMHTLAGVFSGNIIEGLQGLLIQPYRNGLFLVSPFILIGIIGAMMTLKRHRTEKAFLLLIAVVHILIISSYIEWHGGSFYPRYIIWSALLLYLAGALWCLETWEKIRMKKEGLSYWAEFIALVIFAVCAGYGVYANLIDLPSFFGGQNKSLVLGGWSSYLQGAAHWPLFVLIIMIPASWWACKLVFSGAWVSSGHLLKKMFLVSFYVGAGMFLLSASAQIPDWRKRNILVLENFHAWDIAQALPNDLETETVFLPTRYAENVTGTGGNILYPVAYDKPGFLAYRLPKLSAGTRLFLSVDFTITGVGNRVEIALVSPSGSLQPVFAIESQGSETRHLYSKELTGVDFTEEGALVKITLIAKSGAKCLCDARLEFLEIYSN